MVASWSLVNTDFHHILNDFTISQNTFDIAMNDSASTAVSNCELPVDTFQISLQALDIR